MNAATKIFTTQPISDDVLQEKYLKPGETSVEDLYIRVARALASAELPENQAKYEALFLDNLHAGAIGAGRIMSAAGTAIQATLINCFVQPVGDCIQGVDDEGHSLHGLGALQLHQRVRPVLLHRGKCRCTPWRPNGCAAH